MIFYNDRGEQLLGITKTRVCLLDAAMRDLKTVSVGEECHG